MQKPVLCFITCLVTLTISGGLCLGAPINVRISALNDASTTMGVAWTTLSGKAEYTVKYGMVKGTYTHTATGKATFVDTALGSVSEVTLTGLTPDTKYYYRVGGPLSGYSSEYSFSTAPKPDKMCGSASFAVFGDSRAESIQTNLGASATWGKISAAAMTKNPDFFMHGGDIVYEGKTSKLWAHHLQSTAHVSPYLPVMYTIGNHDDGPGTGESANYNKIFHLPRSAKTLGGSGTEDYYYYIWGNAIFLHLTTEGFSSGSPKFQDQANWVDKVLTAHPMRWKFAIMHKPIYTHRISIFTLDLSHDPNEAGQNEAFVKVFNKHHVDMVFGSHNHFYERWAPSNCSTTSSSKPCPVSSFDKGTVYITTGGGGAFPLWCVLSIICPGPTNSTRVAASSAHHYLLASINNHVLKMQVIDVSGKLIDSFSITKSVPVPDPCSLPPPLDSGPPLPDAGTVDGPQTAVDADMGDSSAATDGPQTGQDAPGSQTDGLPADVPKAADAKGSADTNQTPGNEDGCDCRISGQSPGPLSLLFLLALVLLRRQRRAPTLTKGLYKLFIGFLP